VIRIVAGGVTQINHVTSAVGYASSSDLRVHFGTASSASVDSVEVRWPSGAVTKPAATKCNSYVEVVEE
jgi:hypothetical protein